MLFGAILCFDLGESLNFPYAILPIIIDDSWLNLELAFQ